MRTAELINLIYFLFLAILAATRPMPKSNRARAVATGVAGIGLVCLPVYLTRFLQPLPASVIRDWIPSILLLMAYWQAGNFFAGPREAIQRRLLHYDQAYVYPLLQWLKATPGRACLISYMETAYLFCYPLVPMSLGLLYVLHMRAYADKFWTIILPPTYLCYAMVPFLQTLPPRILEHPHEHLRQGNTIRSLNLWILRHASIHANTFPSAHVAASTATALAMFPVAPGIALLFLCIALSIGCGAVIGRYHYAADVLLGGALAAVFFAFERFLRAVG